MTITQLLNKQGKMGNAITHPQSHSMHIIQDGVELRMGVMLDRHR